MNHPSLARWRNLLLTRCLAVLLIATSAVVLFVPVQPSSALDRLPGTSNGSHEVTLPKLNTTVAGLTLSQVGVSAIQCFSPGSCIVVGTWESPTSDAERPVVGSLHESNWLLHESDWSFAWAPTLAGETWVYPDSLSCSGPNRCLAVGWAQGPSAGDRPYAISWDGRAWRLDEPRTTMLGRLNSVSCSDSFSCLAVGFGWTRITTGQPTSTSPIADVWVPSSGWGRIMTPVGTRSDVQGQELSAASCSAEDDCLAIMALRVPGAQIPEVAPARLLHWNGRSWRREPLPNFAKSQISAQSLSCAGPRFCVLVGHAFAAGYSDRRVPGTNGDFIETLLHGRWRLGKPTRMELDSVSCPDPSMCMVVGGVPSNGSGPGTEVSLRWNGSAWYRIESGGFANNLYRVSCASSVLWCIGIGRIEGPSDYSVGEIWDVTDWVPLTSDTTGPHLSGPVSMNAVTCHGALCVAVGESGASLPVRPVGGVLYSDDDGLTWNVASVPAVLADLDEVACTSESHCIAVGVRVLRSSLPVMIVSNDGGSIWRQLPLPKTVRALSDLSCATDDWCVAIGSATQILVSHDEGLTWESHSSPYPAGSISCVPTGVCLSTFYSHGSSGVMRTSDFATTWHIVWRAPPSPRHRTFTTIRSLGTIGSSSASRCLMSVAVGLEVPYSSGIITVTDDGGHSWRSTSQPSKPGGGPASSISCVGPDCLSIADFIPNMTGTIVQASTDGGTHWSAVSFVGGQAASSVTCATSQTCVMVGGQGSHFDAIALTINNGKTWFTPLVPAPVGQ